MKKLIEFLQGKKTYIVAFLFGLFNFGYALGWWMLDNEIWLAINSLLTMLGFGFLRAGMKKK